MRAIISEYGTVLVLCFVSLFCLTWYVDVWYGSDTFMSRLAHNIFNASTSSSTDVSVGDTITVSDKNGSVVSEVQQGSAAKLEEIQSRKAAKLIGAGEQNKSSQLMVDKQYSTSDLFYAIDSDNVEIHKSLTDKNSINDSGYFNDTGYFRALSISSGNGDDIISDLSNLNARESIAYSSVEYPNKTGIAGTRSSTTADTFNIYANDGSKWMTYNVKTQKWMFYKSGTYCLRVFVCDSKGKSTTGTVYITVAKRITNNVGDGNNTTGH